MKPRLISGVQPTGRLHLGNYLGALKNFVDLQNSEKYECFFFIADLHALTENPTPSDLKKNVFDLALDSLAVGLDPHKSVMFLQSQIPSHEKLFWILNTLTSPGEAERMTQFKDKSKTQAKSVNLGLLNYPILMAADVLLYDAEFVPVGEDQLQHLEITRTLARKFNKKFGNIFVEPEALLTNTPRVMSLDEPNKKMSKSRPKGCLFLDDDAEIIKSKIKKAVTDSGKEIVYDPKRKPALANLISVYSALTTWSTKTVEARFKKMSYREFKDRLAELIIRHFEPIQKNKKELAKNLDSVKRVLASGAKTANEIANQKLLEIKKKIGFLVY
ncbi:MAG: tryptophan--tRNA ligase [Patescibacteria group bacterium]